MNFVNGKWAFGFSVIAIICVFIYLFSSICFPFVFGFLLAYLCAPFIEKFSIYINRKILSVVCVIIFMCIFIFAGIYLLPKLKDYLSICVQKAPYYYESFVKFLNKTDDYFHIGAYSRIISAVKNELQTYLDKTVYIFVSLIENIAASRNVIMNMFSFMVIIPLSFFYFLKDWKKMNSSIYDLMPNAYKKYFIEIILLIRKTLGNFFKGQFFIVIILFCYYFLFLSFLKINNCLFLAFLSGLFSFIPFIGAIFSCILVLFVNVSILTFTKIYVVLLIYFVGQILEGYILTPKFISKKTGLHPLWILFSFFAGIQIQGVLGVLMAIPITAVLKNISTYIVKNFKTTHLYKQII